MTAHPRSSAVIDRIKRTLVGLRMPRALEVLDGRCAASNAAK